MTVTIPLLNVGHRTSFGGLTVFPVWLAGLGVTGLDWTPGNIRVCVPLALRRGFIVGDV